MSMLSHVTGRGRPLQPPDDSRLTAERMSLANIPLKRRDADWGYYLETTSYYKALRDYVDKLDEHRLDGIGLHLFGKSGLGKTSAAALIAKEIIRRDGFPYFTHSRDIVPVEFSKGSRAKKKLYSSSFLIIDDLGLEMYKETGTSVIESLVRSREESYLPMIVTTNLTKAELVDSYGEALVRVLTDVCLPVLFK